MNIHQVIQTLYVHSNLFMHLASHGFKEKNKKKTSTFLF